MRYARPVRTGLDSFMPRLAAGTIAMSRRFVDDRVHWHVCNTVGKLVSGRGYNCVVDVGPDSVMRVNLDDPYWNRLIAAGYEYEPELAHVLRAIKSIEFDVLDCGANFGYWSIRLSSHEFGSRQVIAIEASEETFEVLSANCALNGNRFERVFGAISDTAGRDVVINKTLGHSAAHITERAAQPSDQVIKSITLDNFASRVGQRCFVKLDVEGQEINALRGAPKLLAGDVLVCFEDHGLDVESRVTDFVIRELSLNVFFVDARGHGRRVESARDATTLKRHSMAGYNFFACKDGSAFLPPLQALTS